MKLHGPWSSLLLATAALAACGKGSGAKAPSPSIDPCRVGIHAPGISAKAASWDAVALLASTTTDAMCEASPCGEAEPVSLVGTAPDDEIAVKVDGGWVAIGDVWDSDGATPRIELEDLGGGLSSLHLYFEDLGRDEVELDDGERTTATVVVGQRYDDFVIDRASGKVLFRAHCSVADETALRSTKVSRDGDTFAYTRCDGPDVTFRFTAAQASACPSFHEGPQ